MSEKTLNKYIEDVSSSAATPGGGNVAGVVNSLACSLMLMSLRIALLKKDPDNVFGRELEKEVESIKKLSLELASRDSLYFNELMKNYKKGGEELNDSLKKSAVVSLDISEAALELVRKIKSIEIQKFKNIITDVGISLQLASAAFKSGVMNYKINISALKEPAGDLEEKEKKFSSDFNQIFPVLKEKIDRIINKSNVS
ncbi:MAG: cyclodeaminase/cyclohydrolase family protein [Elusimicrobiota bacterium]